MRRKQKRGEKGEAPPWDVACTCVCAESVGKSDVAGLWRGCNGWTVADKRLKENWYALCIFLLRREKKE